MNIDTYYEKQEEESNAKSVIREYYDRFEFDIDTYYNKIMGGKFSVDYDKEFHSKYYNQMALNKDEDRPKNKLEGKSWSEFLIENCNFYEKKIEDCTDSVNEFNKKMEELKRTGKGFSMVMIGNEIRKANCNIRVMNFLSHKYGEDFSKKFSERSPALMRGFRDEYITIDQVDEAAKKYKDTVYGNSFSDLGKKLFMAEDLPDHRDLDITAQDITKRTSEGWGESVSWEIENGNITSSSNPDHIVDAVTEGDIKTDHYFFEEIMDNFDWGSLSLSEKFLHLSDDFIDHFSDCIDWNSAAKRHFLPEEFIENHYDKFGPFLNTLIGNSNLSEKFLRNHFSEIKDSRLTHSISTEIELSEDFMDDYMDELCWKDLSRYQNMSENFIRKHSDKVDWGSIAEYQKLSDNFRKEFDCFDPYEDDVPF